MIARVDQMAMIAQGLKRVLQQGFGQIVQRRRNRLVRLAQTRPPWTQPSPRGRLADVAHAAATSMLACAQGSRAGPKEDQGAHSPQRLDGAVARVQVRSWAPPR